MIDLSSCTISCEKGSFIVPKPKFKSKKLHDQNSIDLKGITLLIAGKLPKQKKIK